MIIDFSRYSYIKIGPKVEVKKINEDNYRNEFLIGGATNTLISPSPPKLGILDDRYKFITIKEGYLRVGAKTKNITLYNFAKRHNIAGFEFLAKLPGSIGGSIKMNAGVKEYEISNNLVALKTLSGWKEKKEIKFDYRFSNLNEPVFEAVFELKKGFDYQRMLYYYFPRTKIKD